MPNHMSQSELTERVIVETAIIMLSSNERDLTYGNEVSWTYIETHLGGENDRKACLHVLKQEARPSLVLVLIASELDLRGPRSYAPYSATIGQSGSSDPSDYSSWT